MFVRDTLFTLKTDAAGYPDFIRFLMAISFMWLTGIVGSLFMLLEIFSR